MRSVVFHEDTLQTYEYLRETNKPIHKKLFNIVKEMQKGDPTQGTGKPEALKHEQAWTNWILLAAHIWQGSASL